MIVTTKKWNQALLLISSEGNIWRKTWELKFKQEYKTVKESNDSWGRIMVKKIEINIANEAFFPRKKKKHA